MFLQHSAYPLNPRQVRSFWATLCQETDGCRQPFSYSMKGLFLRACVFGCDVWYRKFPGRNLSNLNFFLKWIIGALSWLKFHLRQAFKIGSRVMRIIPFNRYVHVAAESLTSTSVSSILFPFTAVHALLEHFHLAFKEFFILLWSLGVIFEDYFEILSRNFKIH